MHLRKALNAESAEHLSDRLFGFSRSPDFLEILKALKIIFLVERAFDAEFREDGHHPTDGDARQVSGLAE
jgi:hypothetical protein